MRRPEQLRHISLADSWVLSVETTDSSVCFVIDAVLEQQHPRFYWPPKPGEMHAYAQVKWCLKGKVHWNDGPILDRPAVGADGERDYGHIDVWIQSGERHTLEGDWGTVVVDRHTSSSTWTDPHGRRARTDAMAPTGRLLVSALRVCGGAFRGRSDSVSA